MITLLLILQSNESYNPVTVKFSKEALVIN